MKNAAACLVFFLAFLFARAAQQPPEDEKEFIRQRNEKKLLDPKTPDNQFRQALVFMSGQIVSRLKEKPAKLDDAKPFFKTLLYGAESYRRKGIDVRFQGCLERVIVLCKAFPKELAKEVPDSLIIYNTELLKDLTKVNKTPLAASEVIEFAGVLGSRAERAIPHLEKIRDGNDDDLAVRAFRALKKINDQKARSDSGSRR